MVDITKKQQGGNPTAPRPPSWPNFGGNIPSSGINTGGAAPSSATNSNSSSTSSNGNSLGGSIGAINGGSTGSSSGILNSSGLPVNGTMGITNSITPMLNFLAPGLNLPKPVVTVSYPRSGITTDVRYVIVQNDGACMELAEDPMITPREMIGISKFIAVVNLVQQTTTTPSQGSVEIYWSELVESLRIERHFVANGLTVSSYNTPDTMHIFLHDPL